MPLGIDGVLRQALEAYVAEERDLRKRLTEIELGKKEILRALGDRVELPTDKLTVPQRVLKWLQENPGLHTPSEVVQVFGKTPAHAGLILGQLAREGSIERITRGVYLSKEPVAPTE